MRARILKIARAVKGWFVRHAATIGKVLLLLALLAVCLVPAFLDNTVIGYLPVLLLVLSVIGSLIYLQVLKARIGFAEDAHVQTCRRGDVVDVGVSVNNKSILLAPRIEVCLFISDLAGEADTTVAECFSLLPKEERELVLSARFDHVGRYKVGLQSIKVYDILGLFHHAFPAGRTQEVLVEPRIVDLARFSVAAQQVSDAVHNRQSVISDGYDYVGLRDYELGDSMKNIHWKASARFEQFLTRIRERQINSNVCIVLDPCSHWDSGERMMCMYDVLVESGLSIAAHANDNGIECSILVPGEQGQIQEFNTRGSWDYTDLLEALPKLQASQDESPACDVVHRVASGVYSSSKLVVVSAGINERLVSEVISASLFGKQVEFIFACPMDLPRVEEDFYTRMLTRLSPAHVLYETLSDASQMGVD